MEALAAAERLHAALFAADRGPPTASRASPRRPTRGSALEAFDARPHALARRPSLLLPHLPPARPRRGARRRRRSGARPTSAPSCWSRCWRSRRSRPLRLHPGAAGARARAAATATRRSRLAWLALLRLPGGRLHRRGGGAGPEVPAAPRLSGLFPGRRAVLAAARSALWAAPCPAASREDPLRARLPWLLALVAALVALAAVGLAPVFDALVAQPVRRASRSPLPAWLPLGLAMGMPMPAGIRLLVARRRELDALGVGRQRRGLGAGLGGGAVARPGRRLQRRPDGGRRAVPGRLSRA